MNAPLRPLAGMEDFSLTKQYMAVRGAFPERDDRNRISKFAALEPVAERYSDPYRARTSSMSLCQTDMNLVLMIAAARLLAEKHGIELPDSVTLGMSLEDQLAKNCGEAGIPGEICPRADDIKEIWESNLGELNL